MKKETPKTEETTQTEPLVSTPVEEPTVEENVPRRYYVSFYKQHPSDSRFDEWAGTIFWSDLQNKVVIEGLENKYSSDVEMLLTMNINLGKGIGISVVQNPKDWVLHLHKANLGYNFYAKLDTESGIVDK